MSTTEPRSVQVLVSRVLDNPQLLEKIREDPASELQKIAKQVIKDMPVPAGVPDTRVYRIVVLCLGITVIMTVGGAIALAILQGSDVEVPQLLTAIGSAAVGALAGLLSPSPSGK